MSSDTSCGLLNAKGRPTKGFTSKGFTLVELLVVIGIIALLISILLPALTRARQQASLVQCESNLRQMGLAIVMYAGDNQGSLPYGFWGGADSNGTGESVWSVLIQPYISKAGSTFADNYAQGGVASAIRKVFVCPDAPSNQSSDSISNTYTQYVCHPRLMPWISAAPAGWVGPDNPDPIIGGNLTPYKLAHIKRSSEIGLIFDASLVQNAQGGWNVPSTVPVAVDLDGGAINPSGVATTHLTDQYSYSGNTGTVVVGPFLQTSSGGLNASQPVNLAAGSSGPWLTHPPNLDVQYNSVNTGAPYGSGNIRMRHLGNTQGPVLMVDGHVQVFNYNIKTYMTDLLRGNINVNP